MMLRGFLHLLIIRILENVSEKNLRPPTSKIHTKCLFFESKSIHLLGDIPKKALFPGTINHHCPLYKALFRPAQLFPRWRPLRFGHDDSSSLPIPLRSTTLRSRTQRYRHLGRHLFFPPGEKVHGNFMCFLMKIRRKKNTSVRYKKKTYFFHLKSWISWISWGPSMKSPLWHA